MTTAAYTTDFYATIRQGVRSSAGVIVPMFLDAIGAAGSPLRVVDVGCGEGWWAEECAMYGCEVIGVDGAHVAPRSPLGERFLAHDLGQPLPGHLAGRFDVALCLEVAEHLPAERAEAFVAELVALAPLILWSAAIPGQGGAGHVHERWPDYWVALFARHGYVMSGALRWRVWSRPEVEPWYAQNLMVVTREPYRYPAVFATPLAHPWPVVHPVIYDWRRP